MKNCPFCAEEIQEQATKCRYCGSDIAAAEAAAREQQDDEETKNLWGKFFGVVGAILFLAGAYYLWESGEPVNALIAVGCAVIYYFIAGLCFKYGAHFGNEYAPNVYLGSDNYDLVKQQMIWKAAPAIGAVAGFGVILVFAVWLAESLPSKPKDTFVAQSAVVTETATPAVPTQAFIESIPTVETPPQSIQLPVIESRGINSEAIAQQVITPAKASFNCELARTFAEVEICSSEELASLDVRLQEMYRYANENAVDPIKLRSDQNLWRRKIRDVCQDQSCIRNAYISRIAELAN